LLAKYLEKKGSVQEEQNWRKGTALGNTSVDIVVGGDVARNFDRGPSERKIGTDHLHYLWRYAMSMPHQVKQFLAIQAVVGP
jgi:hypothetical protein